MGNFIFFFVCLAAFTVNVAVLFLIGWGQIYPKHDIIILAHIAFSVLFVVGMAFAAEDMK